MPGPPTDEDAILAAIRRIVRAIDLHSRELVTRIGVTGPQLAMLRALDIAGTASPSSLARMLNLSAPTVSGIADRLVQRTYVNRSRDEDDRRRVVLSLTDLGREALHSAPTPLQERFRAELAKLADWERTNLLGSLQRIAWMMGAAELEADPLLVTETDPADEPNPTRTPPADDD